ncbi:MAG: type secretion system protein VirB8 [Acetobacteraceae bacterium]|nr:type secretion system protein VirB8 [Acetobacteraceae bacterium]
MPYEGVTAWPAADLTDQSREAFHRAALARWESAQQDTKAIRRHGLIFGAAGLAAGVLGVAAGLVAYLKTPVPPPPGYIMIDRSTGWIDQPVAAKDAPRLFPEMVRERAIRDFIVACESYVPQTWAKLDFHACMIQATPDEQKRRAQDIGRDGSHYPPSVFGPTGWAMPTDFLSFVKLGQTGTEPNQTFSYQVRYQRTEVANGQETRARYTAEIVFSFHPELKISAADRLINPSGFQAVSFSTVRDATP